MSASVLTQYLCLCLRPGYRTSNGYAQNPWRLTSNTSSIVRHISWPRLRVSVPSVRSRVWVKFRSAMPQYVPWHVFWFWLLASESPPRSHYVDFPKVLPRWVGADCLGVPPGIQACRRAVEWYGVLVMRYVTIHHEASCTPSIRWSTCCTNCVSCFVMFEWSSDIFELLYSASVTQNSILTLRAYKQSESTPTSITWRWNSSPDSSCRRRTLCWLSYRSQTDRHQHKHTPICTDRHDNC